MSNEDKIQPKSDEVTNFWKVFSSDFLKLDGKILTNQERRMIDVSLATTFNIIRDNRSQLR